MSKVGLFAKGNDAKLKRIQIESTNRDKKKKKVI